MIFRLTKTSLHRDTMPRVYIPILWSISKFLLHFIYEIFCVQEIKSIIKPDPFISGALRSK